MENLQPEQRKMMEVGDWASFQEDDDAVMSDLCLIFKYTTPNPHYLAMSSIFGNPYFGVFTVLNAIDDSIVA